MVQFFGQLMKLPLEAFVYSMEMFAKTMRGIQQIACRGIDIMADGIAQTLVDAPGPESGMTTGVTGGTIGDSAETAQQTPQKEEEKMADRDFREDELKLVRYKILFVKRDYEHVFYEKEELVHDNITEADYVGWKIAEFIQDLGNVAVPPKWREQPKRYPPLVPGKDQNMINALPEEDKKYLRVYFEVLDHYPRERFKYEEEQIKILGDIAATLEQKVNVEERQVTVLEQIRDRQGGGS
jgi:hypothetical protein